MKAFNCRLRRILPTANSCVWQLKSERDSAKVDEALNALRTSATLTESTSDGNHPMNLVKLSIDAARSR